ncbi:MAG TPA: alpha/beta hydrolase, partial [Acidimicrobiales bacterium]|nr:alpha/beta hydrolase [Acidimicrobiales bacterium]
GDDLTRHPVLADLLVAQDRVPGYMDAVRDFSAALVTARGARAQLALRAADLGRINQPVKLIWGDADPLGPLGLAYECFAALPRCELSTVRGGHAPWLSNGAGVAAELRGFLAKWAA